MNYIEYQADGAIECKSCGWKGTTKQARLELDTQETADLNCPKCAEKIATVVVALSRGELEKMAARGDESAGEILRKHKSIEDSQLKTAASLPELEGASRLDFIWDFEWSAGHEATTVIRLGGRALWKEKAWFGGESRFREVEALLKKRYGARFGSLKVNFDNDDCAYYYYGD